MSFAGKRRVFGSEPVIGYAPRLHQDAKGVVVQQSARTPVVVPPLLAGQVNLNPRGFGFVSALDGQGYYLPANQARAVLVGDQVLFSLKQGGAGLPEVGRLAEVSREAQTMLCELKLRDGYWALFPDEPCGLELALDEAGFHGVEVRVGDVVAVRVPSYKGAPDFRPLVVAFQERLGQRVEPGFDTLYARWRFGFEQEIPAELHAQAEAMTTAPDDFEGLVDLRHIPFVTIDGDDTEDVDDAVFAQQSDAGYLVYVAISDVSHFVKPGSDLDTWAASRGTSLYLPGELCPMLPHALSSGLCSLRPEVARRAVVLCISLDLAGAVTSCELLRAVIVSRAKLTYKGVSQFLSGGVQRYSGEVELALRAVADVAAILNKERTRRGLLDFDEPEPVLKVVDESVEVHWESRTEAHKLVEEFMLLANREAAGLLMRRHGQALLRHQPLPHPDDWKQLCGLVQKMGVSIPMPEQASMLALSNVMAAHAGQEAQAQLLALKIRSAMRPAKYVWHSGGSEDCGHFSLSAQWYTHFTSPIRRYADLLVHRLLLAEQGPCELAEHPEALMELGRQCSKRSHAARLAERRVWDGVKLGVFLTTVPRGEVVRVRILRGTTKGLRVLLSAWQCAAWVMAPQLKAAGFQFKEGVWISPELTLREGSLVDARWTEVEMDRPAYPELHMALALPEPAMV